MDRSVRAKVIVGLIASIGILALVAFLAYWNRGAEAETRGSIPLSLIAGFSGMALVLSGTSAWLLVRELRSSAMKSMSIAANEAEYHELCDNAFDLIDMLTPNGKFIYTNRAWREVLGYSAEEAAHLWLKMWCILKIFLRPAKHLWIAGGRARAESVGSAVPQEEW